MATAIGLCFAVSLGEAATPGLSAAKVDSPLREESARHQKDHQKDPFAIPAIAFGAMLVSDGELGPEGACGEGKCGDTTESAEGKCGEGKCGESVEAEDSPGDADPEEGRCGEGCCGEGSRVDTAKPPQSGEGKHRENLKAEAPPGDADPEEGRCGEGKCGN